MRVAIACWRARAALGVADEDGGMGVDDEYGIGWNDQVAPSQREAHHEAEASRPRATRLETLSATQRARPAARKSGQMHVRARRELA